MSYGINIWTDFSSVLSQSTRLTDRHTVSDGHLSCDKTALHSMQRSRKCMLLMLPLHLAVLPVFAAFKQVCSVHAVPAVSEIPYYVLLHNLKQDARLSQKDCAAGCVIVFAKNGRLELGDNILRTL